MRARSRLLPLIAIAFVSYLGCVVRQLGKDDSAALSHEESALLDDGSDSAQAGDTASAIVSVPLLAIDKAELVANVDAALAAAATSGAWFVPKGCVTANQVGAVVTYTFAGCTGPFGLVAVNGKIVATVSKGAAPSSIDVAVKSEGLTLNKTPIDQSATAHVSYSGTTRTVRWDGQYHGVTAGGRKIDHDAGYTSSYDTASGCVTLSGTGQTTVDGRGVKTEVTDYLRCGDRFACPTSGEIVTTGVVSGLSIKVDFLGGNKADVTGVGGRVYHVTLSCKT